MTDYEESFDAHPRFEPTGPGGWEPTTNDWDATVRVEGDAVAISVAVPTLDAVVAGEPVAAVVADGWYETLELRLEDVDGVTYATITDLAVQRDSSTVTVDCVLDPRPGKVADDALAVVNYVEGTWFEGIIPGYDYVESVQAMRERAHQHGQGGSTGTPL